MSSGDQIAQRVALQPRPSDRPLVDHHLNDAEVLGAETHTPGARRGRHGRRSDDEQVMGRRPSGAAGTGPIVGALEPRAAAAFGACGFSL
jgi:hypothetical protein